MGLSTSNLKDLIKWLLFLDLDIDVKGQRLRLFSSTDLTDSTSIVENMKCRADLMQRFYDES